MEVLSNKLIIDLPSSEMKEAFRKLCSRKDSNMTAEVTKFIQKELKKANPGEKNGR